MWWRVHVKQSPAKNAWSSSWFSVLLEEFIVSLHVNTMIITIVSFSTTIAWQAMCKALDCLCCCHIQSFVLKVTFGSKLPYSRGGCPHKREIDCALWSMCVNECHVVQRIVSQVPYLSTQTHITSLAQTNSFQKGLQGEIVKIPGWLLHGLLFA